MSVKEEKQSEEVCVDILRSRGKVARKDMQRRLPQCNDQKEDRSVT